ncbi:CASP C terminal-domain-containing protein [Polychytrium aggregatum]|uniref:CASP C terminal-domain-containing protein n=1 Tax=Polychytrium aggregatum TaxID=110093 RepID=UPI0022FF0836|nr:CASP C terminal-domain-containing protein [Polychytrium aggregatum]KAI9190819.1 CASP C terminal-domain-containing protein [Polychytrium aggregatum]
MDEGLLSAIKFWQNANLSKLQRELDEQGLEIVENQKEGLASRKKLAEQTKDFKRLPDDEKQKEFKNLLKGYQSEIDCITKRTKAAETAFLSLYKLLADAPDPAPLISGVAEHASKINDFNSLQIENEKLREELAAANAQTAALKSSEANAQALKQRLSKYEAKLDEMVLEKVTQKENEMKQFLDEKIRIYKETEYSLQRQLNQSKDLVLKLQSTNNQTQALLVDHSQKYDNEIALKLGELEICLMDLERANLKNAQLERDNENLLQELQDLRGTDGETSDLREAESSFKTRVESQETELARLRSEGEKLQSALAQTEQQSSARIAKLERDCKIAVMEASTLRNRLSEMEDYEEIKKELEVMKFIEFSSVVRSSDSPDDIDVSALGEYSLEKLMLEKNRRMQVELTDAKVLISELQTQTAELQRNLIARTDTVEQQRQLIHQLEDDIHRLNVHSGASRKVPTSPTDGLAELISSRSFAGGAASPPSTPTLESSGSGSIIPILTSQRDRYRQKNVELEETIRTLNVTLSQLQSQVETLKSDNVKLYEKLRYTESYSEHRSRGGHAAIDMELTGLHSRGNDVAAKYKPIYEGNLDPFQRFHKQEEAKRMNSLNPIEKLMLQISRLILASKYARWIFLAYCALLHMLVMMILYRLSVNSSATECSHEHEWADYQEFLRSQNKTILS